MKTFNFIFAIMVLATAAPAQEPSFDCAKATSEVEKQICSDSTLAHADADLAEAWGAYIEAQQGNIFWPELLETQRNWLEYDRDTACAESNDACLKAYRHKIAALEGYGGSCQNHEPPVIVETLDFAASISISEEMPDEIRCGLFELLRMRVLQDASQASFKSECWGDGCGVDYGVRGDQFGQLLQIGIFSDGYLGGAHPGQVQESFFYDVRLQRRLQMSDLFLDKEKAMAAIRDGFVADWEKNTLATIGADEAPDIKDELEGRVDNFLDIDESTMLTGEAFTGKGFALRLLEAESLCGYASRALCSGIQADMVPLLQLLKPEYREFFIE